MFRNTAKGGGRVCLDKEGRVICELRGITNAPYKLEESSLQGGSDRG